MLKVGSFYKQVNKNDSMYFYVKSYDEESYYPYKSLIFFVPSDDKLFRQMRIRIEQEDAYKEITNDEFLESLVKTLHRHQIIYKNGE